MAVEQSNQEKRLEGCDSTKDITVSKLSQLQKQVLVFARKAMLTKNQQIEDATNTTIFIPAPEWLSKALTEALGKVFRGRKIYHLDGINDLTSWHPWLAFFEEVAFVERTLQQAAEKAGVDKNVSLTRLFDLADNGMLFGLRLHGKLIYAPWPSMSWDGWYFRVYAKDMTVDETWKALKAVIVEDLLQGITVTRDQSCPVNCTIPELLHNLYQFPMRQNGVAHLGALAFSPEQIGKARYNSAHAALRRACERLRERDLIRIRSGQASLNYRRYYERTGVALTHTGVIVADRLIAS